MTTRTKLTAALREATKFVSTLNAPSQHVHRVDLLSRLRRAERRLADTRWPLSNRIEDVRKALDEILADAHELDRCDECGYAPCTCQEQFEAEIAEAADTRAAAADIGPLDTWAVDLDEAADATTLADIVDEARRYLRRSVKAGIELVAGDRRICVVHKSPAYDTADAAVIELRLAAADEASRDLAEPAAEADPFTFSHWPGKRRTWTHASGWNIVQIPTSGDLDLFVVRSPIDTHVCCSHDLDGAKADLLNCVRWERA